MEGDKRKSDEGLPDDLVLHHIIPRLAIKQVTQCKVLSKLFHSSICSPNFILHHTKQPLIYHHPGPPVEHLFIQLLEDYFVYSCVNDDNVANHTDDQSTLIKLDVEFQLTDCSHPYLVILVGTANGLVCLAEITGVPYFFLYNPATNQSRKYCFNDSYRGRGHNWGFGWGFGYVSSLNDFKVVRIIFCRNRVGCKKKKNRVGCTVEVFSLNSNTVRKIEFNNIVLEKGVYLGRAHLANETVYFELGTVYFELRGVVASKNLAFDLCSESLDWYPKDYGVSCVNSVIGGCLSKRRSNSENQLVFDIAESPGKVVSVCFPCNLQIDHDVKVVGFTKTGKVFVACKGDHTISLLDRNLNRTLVEFEESQNMAKLTLIESYVPTQASPFPSSNDLPSSSNQGT